MDAYTSEDFIFQLKLSFKLGFRPKSKLDSRPVDIVTQAWKQISGDPSRWRENYYLT